MLMQDTAIATAQTSAGDASGDVLSSFENLAGSAQADTLAGDAQANALSGGAGNDTLEGRAGADTLDGEAVVPGFSLPLGSLIKF